MLPDVSSTNTRSIPPIVQAIQKPKMDYEVRYVVNLQLCVLLPVELWFVCEFTCKNHNINAMYANKLVVCKQKTR